MQMGSGLALRLLSVSFSCGKSPNNCVLFWLPDPRLPVQLVTTLIFIFVGSSSEAGLTSLKKTGLWAEPEQSILPQPRPTGRVNLESRVAWALENLSFLTHIHTHTGVGPQRTEGH